MYYDVCVHIQVDSIGVNKDFVTFIDDFSIKLWTYLINKKSDVINVFTKFKSTVGKQCGQKIKILRTGDGKEYVSRDFDALYEREWIVREVVPPYTPQ